MHFHELLNFLHQFATKHIFFEIRTVDRVSKPDKWFFHTDLQALHLKTTFLHMEEYINLKQQLEKCNYVAHLDGFSYQIVTVIPIF